MNGNHLNESVSILKNIGAGRLAKLKNINVHTVADLISHYPRDYKDFSHIAPIKNITAGETCVIKAVITKEGEVLKANGLTITKIKAADGTGEIEIVWYNQPYLKNHFAKGNEYIFCGKVSHKFNTYRMEAPVYEPADGREFLTGGRIVPVYPLTEGISQKIFLSFVKEALDRFAGEITEELPDHILKKYELCDKRFAVRNIHFPENGGAFLTSRKRLVFDELLFTQLRLDRIKQDMQKKSGYVLDISDTDVFLQSLPFTLTDGQAQVGARDRPFPIDQAQTGLPRSGDGVATDEHDTLHVVGRTVRQLDLGGHRAVGLLVVPGDVGAVTCAPGPFELRHETVGKHRSVVVVAVRRRSARRSGLDRDRRRRRWHRSAGRAARCDRPATARRSWTRARARGRTHAGTRTHACTRTLGWTRTLTGTLHRNLGRSRRGGLGCGGDTSTDVDHFGVHSLVMQTAAPARKVERGRGQDDQGTDAGGQPTQRDQQPAQQHPVNTHRRTSVDVDEADTHRPLAQGAPGLGQGRHLEPKHRDQANHRKEDTGPTAHEALDDERQTDGQSQVDRAREDAVPHLRRLVRVVQRSLLPRGMAGRWSPDREVCIVVSTLSTSSRWTLFNAVSSPTPVPETRSGRSPCAGRPALHRPRSQIPPGCASARRGYSFLASRRGDG